MAKARASPGRRIPKARRVLRSPLSRRDVTRREYNRIIDVLNERNIITKTYGRGSRENQHI